jgi:hypothetical protein
MLLPSRNNPIYNIAPEPKRPLRPPYLHIHIHMIHLVLKNHLSHIQKSPCHNRHNQQHHPQLQKHPRPQSRTPTNLVSRSDPPCLSIPTTERFPTRILEERTGRPLDRGRWLILNEGRGRRRPAYSSLLSTVPDWSVSIVSNACWMSIFGNGGIMRLSVGIFFSLQLLFSHII